ncbi:MAG: hypothetical protein KME17_29210 [Cyanosarcina radialis HA8281-LM2]|jgi:hypothetical protein|nr:hypothetical protein [Cyanosarcina radialis HA8281-LM2]
MHNQLRNSLVISALAICGVVAGNSGAIAAPVDSADIPFNGTMTNMCAFGTPTAGTLGDITSPTQDYLESYSGTGATDASINLSCNGDAQLAITDIQEVSVPSGMTSSAKYISVWDSNGGWTYFDTTGWNIPSLITGPSNQNLNVQMRVSYTTAVKPGSYQYTTKLTATPQ